MTKKTTVVLLFGGRSSEHEISCVTAAGVLSAMDADRFEVIPVGITQAGATVLADEQVREFALTPGNMPQVSDNGTRIHWPESPESKTLTVTRANGSTVELGEIDVVFPVLHGPFGEDGTVQGMLDLLDVPYVGSGVLASALCMDKHYAKTVLHAAGIEVAPWRTVHANQIGESRDARRTLAQDVAKTLGLPLFVKPARAGSSVGVSKVQSLDEFDAALDRAFAADSEVLIEGCIVGREIELAVLEGRDGVPRVSAVAGEIVITDREFYDYEAKYLGAAGVELQCPAELASADLTVLRKVASRAFLAVGCAGLARIDFFLTAAGPVVNEINTMPGFTPISMFPTLWQHSGLSYEALVTELIDLALHSKS